MVAEYYLGGTATTTISSTINSGSQPQIKFPSKFLNEAQLVAKSSWYFWMFLDKNYQNYNLQQFCKVSYNFLKDGG
jgi:hypothetical protein